MHWCQWKKKAVACWLWLQIAKKQKDHSRITFVNLAHDGNLQVLLIIMFVVESQQNSTKFWRKTESRHHIHITESLQSQWELLHCGHGLLHILQTQHVYHWETQTQRHREIHEQYVNVRKCFKHIYCHFFPDESLKCLYINLFFVIEKKTVHRELWLWNSNSIQTT